MEDKPASFVQHANVAVVREKGFVEGTTPQDSIHPAGRLDKTHRMLKVRCISPLSPVTPTQVIRNGGTEPAPPADRHRRFPGAIGTLLFVQIGQSLTKGGPANLFFAFVLWCTVIVSINNCLAEMVTWIPISSPFIRFADYFVDPAFGFALGVNYFVTQAFGPPFEVTAFYIVLQFWTDKVPVVAVIFVVLVSYTILNTVAVGWYGESEFWLAIGKVILALGFMAFTFITMVGGNPLHDKYGFRNWDPSKVPGTPFAEHIKTGSLGRFLGFVACLTQATYIIVGPDYVAMAAGEAKSPRKNMPKAFNAVTYRLIAFFVLGAFCVGTVIPYSDENLLNATSHVRPGAGASPYVIAMQRLQIKVLPHIVNFLILTSIYSAGNEYLYCSSRILFGLALEGKAPKLLTWCSPRGIPIYCVGVVFCISLLAFLQVSNNSAVVLQWIISLTTASGLLSYAAISYTYIRFYKALKVQGISRDSLPFKGFGQPFCAYYSLIATLTMTFVNGYEVFLPGRWSVTNFLFSYVMIAVTPILYLGWKVIYKTKKRGLHEITFFNEERAEIDEQEDMIG